MKLCMGQDFGRSGLRVVQPILPAYLNHTLPLHLLNPYLGTQPTHEFTHSLKHIWIWLDMSMGM